ncbi:MAG: hypothetical protein M1497_07855 [Nitrospirae bacterium]|nr:hypothetical protein [Nitrospirota bacterium]
MKKCFGIVAMVLLLAGCGTGSKLNIVSPSLSDEELKERGHMVTREKSPSAAPEEAPAQQAKPETPREKTRTETGVSEKSLRGDKTAEEALINLLEKKGIITKKELSDEIERLKEKSK